MSRKIFVTTLIIALIANLLTACGAPAATSQAQSSTPAPAASQSAESKSADAAAPAETTDGEIVFGVISAITGSFPMAGEMTRKGVEMACEEINSAGGVLGKKLVPQFEDDAAKQDMAVNAAKKLISDKVVAILGPNMSTNVIAISEDIKAAKMPTLVGGTSPKIYDLNNEYIFRIRPADTISAAAAAQYMYEDVGARTIGVLTNNDDFGSGGKDVILSYLNTKDDVTVVEQGVNSGDKDLTGQIVMFKNAGIDALIYWGHDAEVSILARQTTELGLDVPTVTSGSLPQVVGSLDAEYVAGWCVSTDMSAADTRPAMAEFVKKFNEKYSMDPEVYATAFYGGTILLADALQRAGSTDAEALVKALQETKDVAGPIGNYNCQPNRDMLKGCTIMQYDGNKEESVVANVVVG